MFWPGHRLLVSKSQHEMSPPCGPERDSVVDGMLLASPFIRVVMSRKLGRLSGSFWDSARFLAETTSPELMTDMAQSGMPSAGDDTSTRGAEAVSRSEERWGWWSMGIWPAVWRVKEAVVVGHGWGGAVGRDGERRGRLEVLLEECRRGEHGEDDVSNLSVELVRTHHTAEGPKQLSLMPWSPLRCG